ncbi:trehalose operon repressor [Bifidobacterium choloepi]|uniref:Trehalose operon repressor n=1 Tax=Bifidobacterium choloepi TaxID=2614131 RepID=A0A6I5N7J6_9BIFI|nr:trehalose operon repressor [Bifidobacterium choloepi]NEG69821.1 trehalose operon repressor [Bifidobacterium choloepi]
MPKARFGEIYKDLKDLIEAGEYPEGALLPSENDLATQYDCSRNTVRRALARLAADGYVQSQQGKGVRSIYAPADMTTCVAGTIESFQERAERSHRDTRSEVLLFEDIVADDDLASETGFPHGISLIHIIRVRCFDDEPLIVDHNWFRRDVMPLLTPQIATGSIYDYLENDLGLVIATSKRVITVELADDIDRQCLDLGDYNSVAVVTSQVFSSDGVQFEYTRSRHQPDVFRFQDVATRSRLML